MVRVGIVGIGFMGMMHYLAYRQVKGARVTAICTRDPKKLAGDWRGIQGNFGPPGAVMDLGQARRHADWRALLADPQVDLVDICLPPALHAEVAVAAARAGKQVVCEKPIALTVSDAERMVKTAVKAGTRLFIAQVLPFFPEYAFVRKTVASGKYGRLLGGHFKRVISDPLWIKDFYDPKGAGGPVVDLQIHDAHFIRLLLGQPSAVFSTGRWRGDVVEFVQSQFMYADSELSLSATSGVINQQARSFTHGFEIHLEKATLVYDFSVVAGEAQNGTPLTVLTQNGQALRPDLKGGDAFVAELSEVARCVRTGQPSELLDGGLALDALVLCHKQTQSVKSGKIVKV